MHNHSAPAASTLKLPFYRQLYFQVVLAIVLGVLLGHFEPAYGEALKPLGEVKSANYDARWAADNRDRVVEEWKNILLDVQ